MSDETVINTSIKSEDNKKNLKLLNKRKKPLVTAMPDPEEEKKSSANTRGIPRAKYLANPYDVIYKNQQERYLKEVEETLGKYKLMESQLVKQKINKINQREEMRKNITACNYLIKQKEAGCNEIKTQFEVSDQLYSEGTITEFETVSIWLGANVMMEFPINEAIEFLEKRIVLSCQKIETLQSDIDFTREQMNIIEVNRSRVYNAGVKVKKARESATAKNQFSETLLVIIANSGDSDPFMDKVKQNKVAIGAAVTGAVLGAAALYYIYSKKSTKDEDNTQRTFAFIKPDAFKHSDDIMKQILDAGFTIVKSRRITLSQEQASLFYLEHKGKPFFQELITFMTSGPVWALLLERHNAVRFWRDLMGSTNPDDAKKSSPKSIRAVYGTDITNNAVHGSDSTISAEREIGFFFDD